MKLLDMDHIHFFATDLDEAVRFYEDIGFDMSYIFKYSPRSGTPAADMEDQVTKEEKERRNQVLLDILAERSLWRNQSLVGTVEEVLVEGPARRGEAFTGKTRGFRTTIFEADDRLIGQLVPLKITRATVSSIYGELALAGVDR